MEKAIIKCGDIEVEKHKFHQHKRPISIKNIDINKELLKKFNEIWEKIKNTIKKKFVSKPVYNEKYLKAKIKWNGKINTIFHNNKIPN